MAYKVKSNNSSGNTVCDLNAPELGNGVLISNDFVGTRVTLNLKDPTEIPFDIRIESAKILELELVSPFHLRCNIILAGHGEKLNLRISGIERVGSTSGETSRIVITEDRRTSMSGRVVTLNLDRIGPPRDSHLPSEVAQNIQELTKLHLHSGVALDATFRDCSNCSIALAGQDEQGVVRSLIVTESALSTLRIEDTVTAIENLSLNNTSIRELYLVSPVVRCTLSNSRILGGCFLPSRLVRLEVPRYVKLQETEVNVGTLEFACLDRSNLDLSDADYVDQWNILRDTYTGARFFINLLFLVLYCLPLASRVAVYWGMGAMEDASGRGDLVPAGWVVRTVAEILFFGTSNNETVRWVYFVLAMSVMLYQALRLYLTIKVSSLREREEHMDAKGYKNTRPPYDKLTGPYLLHRVMIFLLLLAMTSVVWRVAEVLMMKLHVPAG